VREAGLYSMLAAPAAIAGDEPLPRTGRLRPAPVRRRGGRERQHHGGMGPGPARSRHGALRYGAQSVRDDRDRTARALHPADPVRAGPDRGGHQTRLRRPGCRAAGPLRRLGRGHRPAVGAGRAAPLPAPDPGRGPGGALPRGAAAARGQRPSVRARPRRAALRRMAAPPAGARMPAPTCGPLSRSSTGPGPRPGPNGPGSSCVRRGSPPPPGLRRRTG
jgi:hypothetical protein